MKQRRIDNHMQLVFWLIPSSSVGLILTFVGTGWYAFEEHRLGVVQRKPREDDEETGMRD